LVNYAELVTAKVPPGWQIQMMLPVRGRWQQFRLRKPDTFVCAGCDQKQSTELVAVADFDWSAPTCNRCYSLAVEAEGAQRPVSLPPVETSRIAQSRQALRSDDFETLGKLLIAKANSRPMGNADQAFIKTMSGTGTYQVALAYAAAAFEVGLAPARRSPGLVKRLRSDLRVAVGQDGRRRQAELARHGKPARVEDPLEALVLCRLRPEAFRKALASVLTQDKRTGSRLEMPAENLWHWLNIVRDQRHPTGPPDVIRLRSMTSEQFVGHLVALARRDKPSMTTLADPVLVEQWVRHAAAVTRSLHHEHHRASQTGKVRSGTKAAYARAQAMETAATVALENLRHRIRMHSDPAKLQQRTTLFMTAVAKVTGNDPWLTAALRDICATHTPACTHARRGESCAPCVPVIVARLRARMAERTRPPARQTPKPLIHPNSAPKMAGTPAALIRTPRPEAPAVPLLGPGKERRVRCLPAGGNIDPGTTHATWEVAVTRDDITRGRCPLPDGTTLPLNDTRPLNLQFQLHENHPDAQRVKLRVAGGIWELTGVHWPTPIQPGVLVMLTWPTDSADVIAWTKPLHRPERINGVVYHDQFDRHIVTRELLPGIARLGGAQGLSAPGWVMRTLQVLGYLCPEGTATLPEDALIRNCLSLGMPSTMTDEIPAAIKTLIAEKKVRRVRGSRNACGQPLYPARPGDQPVELLRYIPSVQIVDPRPTGSASSGGRGVQEVHGFLRRLPDGAHASDAQLELYYEAVAAAEIANRPIDPTRYTFVATHRRGATPGSKEAPPRSAR